MNTKLKRGYSWVSAHIIMSHEWVRNKRRQPSWLVEERILLIRIRNGSDALKSATRIAKTLEIIDDIQQKVNGVQVDYRFIGVRKIITPDFEMVGDRLMHAKPGVEFSEITFSFYLFAKRRDVRSLAAGREVGLVYLREPLSAYRRKRTRV